MSSAAWLVSSFPVRWWGDPSPDGSRDLEQRKTWAQQDAGQVERSEVRLRAGVPRGGRTHQVPGCTSHRGGGGAGEEEEEGEAEELGEEEEVEGRGAGDTRARAPPCGGAEAAEGSREEEQRVPAAFVPCRGLFCK